MNNNLHPIPFEFADKLPMFSVKVNGECKQFILDSGSPFMVLNCKYENDSGVSNKPISTSLLKDVVMNMEAKLISSFEWGDLRLANQLAMVTDISHLEQKLKTVIHGLIGCAQFMNYDLLLNYQKRQVILIDSYGEANDLISGAKIIPFTMSNHIPVIPINIGDKSLFLGLDTGAAWNVIKKEYKEYFEKMDLICNETQDDVVRFNQDDSEQGVYGGSIKEVTIGENLKINNMNFAFHDLRVSDDETDGLMGYELFSRYISLIRYAKRELLLKHF